MNYFFYILQKNKLKNDAIPTENGPFCVQPYKEEVEVQGNTESELPINIDDIENEFTPMSDRKAHFSVKYGDFLTNDVSDTITLTPDYKSTSIKLQDKGMIFNRCNRKMRSAVNNQTSSNSNVKTITNLKKVKLDKDIADESSTFENKLPNPKVVSIESNELNFNTTKQNAVPINKPTNKKSNLSFTRSSSIPPSKKVRIISEKHISEPMTILPGDLQPVSPSIVIKVPNKQRRSNIEIDGREIKTHYVDNIQNVQPTKNVQEPENSMMTYTHSPRFHVTDQMHLNTYRQPTTYVDQIAFNNLAIQNEDPQNDIKLIEYLPSEANQNSQQLEIETGLFTNVDHNMSMTPNVEFVSCSKTGPLVFTLTDVPQVKTSNTDSSYMDNEAAKNALLSMDSEVLTANQGHVYSEPMKAVQDMLEMSENMLSEVNEKPTPKIISPNKSMSRYKMHPEKLAAIEEKRKYNMKLRDIINSCLNNMDDEPDVGKLTAAMKKELGNKKVEEYISKDPSRPHSQEDVISYFETRLQRMEDNLLNKIEQNTLKITDLNKSFKKPPPTRKTGSTQTYFSSEATKRSLYEQMSQYLTPGTNSLIYEELFISRCVSKTEPKRRKRRCDNNYKEL